MAPLALLIFFVFTHLLVLNFADEASNNTRCPDNFFCNKIVGDIGFPFKNSTHPPECGLYTVDCSAQPHPTIQLEKDGYWHEFEGPILKGWIHINDEKLQERFNKYSCDDGLFTDWSLPVPSPDLDVVLLTFNLFKCHNTQDHTSYANLTYGCSNTNYTYYTPSDNRLPSPAPPCSIIQVPADPSQRACNLSAWTTKFWLKVVSGECARCIERKSVCQIEKGKYVCAVKGGAEWKLGLGLGLGLGIGLPALVAVCLFILWRYKQRRASSNLLSRNISCQPYTNSDIEGGYFGVPVFTYNELEEATNHFDSEKELGDGGFGTVYHGKLKDGREVAVKRLYEHNYKRVEQFMNEIEILTRLRHQNLVSLYGCTSRRSRELLLVYEYIPNGTVADHLHGDGADPASLTWPTRMSIAIETASALSYLHASEIVHRDVKTTNILLDNNFCVKVADFGLSRLFPTDVTHVSTAPQGTPGYVDPEYHQCYQLTSKSDVYSFGVVLIELISSMPAVDICRDRHEINLANLAIKKIQKALFNELVDPCLGFESDDEVRRMIIAVAELAFQCLQQDNDMRPTMNEVLEALKIIESRKDVPENLKLAFDNAETKTSKLPPPSPECDEVGLLKNIRPPPSPISVTHTWPSTRSTTPNASC